MTAISTSQTKKSSNQATGKDKEIFEKEEHQLIYCTFLDTLEDPKKQIQKIREKLQKKLPKKQEQELQSKLESLGKLSCQLENEDEKKVVTFVFENNVKIFDNVNQKIKSLSEENFCQFLLSVFGKIREKNLASKENLENGEIEKVVKECVDNIRDTEAKDSLKKLVGWPLGIKIDPKNFSGSLKDGILKKVPLLGKKEEEDERPLSDEEMVTKFLGRVFLPILFSIVSISVFGPTIPAMIAAVVGVIFAVKGGIEVLFLNNKLGAFYSPDTKEWGKEISSGISNVLESKVNGIDESKQPNGKGAEQLIDPSTKLKGAGQEDLLLPQRTNTPSL
ncbi:hypothetical protein [Wolbachia endosymbiont of Ctenocephalides felis wCfeJ]|uniref:hypothetical protein n=1 Tax=Wolbachia endosymbiont of Ctenocephalides felis wCfeJ TaxID=2732594 RepID=UPI001445BAA5|nr:hypothetical protein [Wolbachia endosymbiont of Ctenocephalides felis wCfeJ]WCR58223.1 MAG: hypothetical protein PG980_000695 [Wolbachia endosymbiont of Ctenocephalides felis wCfeJ]